MSAVDALSFELPAALAAHEPPEVRGAGRDDVRLMVASRHDGAIRHAHFAELPNLLEPGDLLVLNTSATVPAALPATAPTGEVLELHLSTRLPGDDLWIVELRRPAGPTSLPWPGSPPSPSLALPEGGSVELLRRYHPGGRLWIAAVGLPTSGGSRGGPGYVGDPAYLAGPAYLDYLDCHGRPIRYGPDAGDWPLAAYQTVYATEPGSAELPSAGRPFTPELITRLVAHGVEVAPLILHTGVSSPEEGEPPYPEWFRVPASTARRINAARVAGGRLIAVGTTVVRALETVVSEVGGRCQVHPGQGWTEVVVTPEHPVRAVDGLLTGWHEPRASHLALVETVAGRALLELSYSAALEAGYRWHEFGDSHLILP